MGAPVAERDLDVYLDRLRDVLPAERREEVVAEVRSLVEERLEADAESGQPASTARALAALGAPEALASSLVGGTVTIDLAMRRAYARLLGVVFGGHLLLAILLTALGAHSPLVPGLVGALPRGSWFETSLGVLGIFFADAGLLLVLFALLGRRRAPAVLHHLRLSAHESRRDAALSLVLLGLVALLVNVPSLRDSLFAVGTSEQRAPLLAAEVVALLPVANVMLFGFAVRHASSLLAGGERVLGVLGDGVGALAGAIFCVLLMTRDEIAQVPTSSGLSTRAAEVFEDLLLRVVILVALVAGLILAARFVRRLLRLRELVAR